MWRWSLDPFPLRRRRRCPRSRTLGGTLRAGLRTRCGGLGTRRGSRGGPGARRRSRGGLGGRRRGLGTRGGRGRRLRRRVGRRGPRGRTRTRARGGLRRCARLGRGPTAGLGRRCGVVATSGRCVRLAQAPDDRCLQRRRRGLDEFSLIAELRQKFFTGDTELFGQFVYPGLACHCSPHCEVSRQGWPRDLGLHSMDVHRWSFTVCSSCLVRSFSRAPPPGRTADGWCRARGAGPRAPPRPRPGTRSRRLAAT